jgi:hypothetical protein
MAFILIIILLKILKLLLTCIQQLLFIYNFAQQAIILKLYDKLETLILLGIKPNSIISCETLICFYL